MTLDEKARLSCYQTISVLNEEHGVFVAQHTENRQIFVKKILSVYNRKVYEYLKVNHILGIPYIYEVFEDDGKLIVIEEYIKGESLQSMLEERGHLTEEMALFYFRQLSIIVQRLHKAVPPIIHRDIKPSNVLMMDSGQIRLLDMNAARQQTPGAGQDTRMIGTVGYAAPEQYGFAASDARTDIYALGVLLNVMLTGCLPQEKLAQGRYQSLIQRATRLEPGERFQSIADMLQALDDGIEVNDEPIEPEVPEKDRFKNRLPGFRTDEAYKWIWPMAGYLLLLYGALRMEVENAGPLQVWLNRFVVLAMMFSIILFSGNYRGAHRLFGVDRIRTKRRKIWTIVVIDCLIAMTWVVMLLTVEKAFFV